MPPALRAVSVSVAALVCACSGGHGEEASSTPQRQWPPAERVVPIPDTCRGARLTFSETTLADDSWPCACHEELGSPSADGASRSVRAGDWCGLPQPNEGRAVDISVSADTALLQGAGTHVVVRLRNSGAVPASYRFPTRHLYIEWVSPDGSPLPHTVFGSGPYPDEAIVGLDPGGTLDLTLSVAGTRVAWDGDGEDAGITRQPLSPGHYALRVFLGGLGGVRARLIPVEVR
jgi:hypothetical protein